MAASDVQFRIPFTTLLKIALFVLLAVVMIKLWPVFLMIVIAVLIAVMLDPIIVWLEVHRIRKSIAGGAVAFVLFGALILFVVLLVPAIVHQLAELSRQVPQIEQRIVAAFPPARSVLLQSGPAESPELGVWISRGLTAGMFALEGVTAIVFVLVVAIYLLVEGRRAFAWLVSFSPREHRRRIDVTAREIGEVVLAYMRGNVITSFICAVYVLVVLAVLHVPLALLLAVMAFVFDFVPVVGTIAMTVPAALVALMVSPMRALLVVVAYLLYHLVENYVIIPRVYGSQMRLSTLTVLLAIAIGGTLQGVIGAVLALPIAAAYPIVERIWLRESLPDDTVTRHEQLEQTQT